VTIKNYFSKPNTWAKRGVAAVILAGAGAILGSCGGGGASTDTVVQPGSLALLPGSGSLYANVPFNFVIAGGVRPYTVTTSEQTLIANLPTLNSNNFTVVPNNPGVVDPQTDPNIVPSRTIRFTVRDRDGTQIVTGNDSFKVVQNFITGYRLTINSLFACGVSSTGAAVSTEGCTGTESAIDLFPTTGGVLYRNRPLRFSINYGEFLFVDKNSSPPDRLVPTVTLTTSGATAPTGTESGSLRAFLRTSDTARTQYAGLRITDVQSGVYRDVDFLIINPTVTTKATLIPASIGPLTGIDASKCGSGGVDVRISGGKAPYSITVSASSRAIVSVNPPIVLDANGIFTVGVAAAPAPNSCLTEPNAVTVTDANGLVTTFGVTTTAGSGAAVLPLTVSPNVVACLANAGSPGSTASIAVNGGNDLKVLSSQNPTAVTVTPATGTGAFIATLTGTTTVPTPAEVFVNVNDGAGNIANVRVTRKATCP
jgi:hypothetical protein